MLRQVVVNYQHVPALVHELLGHGTTSVGGQILQRGRVGGAGGHHDSVPHRIGFLQRADHLGHLALLLPDGDVDADEVAALLVDDRVDGDGGLARGAVANDQLALTAADGNHGVYGLDARLDRGVHRLAHHHVGGNSLG